MLTVLKKSLNASLAFYKVISSVYLYFIKFIV